MQKLPSLCKSAPRWSKSSELLVKLVVVELLVELVVVRWRAIPLRNLELVELVELVVVVE